MPTDDERREVAARLRDMAPGSDWPNYVAEACGMDVSKMSNNFHTFTEQLCQRIADLIEPDERTCHMRDMRWDDGQCTWGCICSECGARREHESGRWLNFCPNCGARVIQE